MKTRIQLRALCEKAEDGKLRIVASDETIDRSGESIPFESWDLANFLKSPRLLIDHDYRVQAIVGKAENVVKDEKRRAITFEPVFHDITQAAKDTREMVEQGFLDTVSVGFLRGQDEKGTEANELMEISFVAVPANPSARTLSVKDIDDTEAKAVEAFLGNTVMRAAAEGDVCTMEDGTEGTLQLDDSGALVCMLSKSAADDGGEAKAEGDPCTMDDGSEGMMQMDADGNLVCMLPQKGQKGAVADQMASEDMWRQKYEKTNALDKAVCALWRVYFDEETPVDAFPGLVAEMIQIIQPLAGEAAATESIGEFLETDDGKAAAEEGIKAIRSVVFGQAVDSKAGRVLSEKNRGIITAAKDALASGIAALDDLLKATETPQGDEEDVDDGKDVEASKGKGRMSHPPQAEDSYEKFIQMRKVMRAVSTAMSEALREAKQRKP